MSNQVQLISTIRFFEFGKKAPKGSRFKGEMKTESLVGWAGYTGNELKKTILNDSEILEYQASGFFNYTSKRIGSTKTYTNEGWIESEEHSEKFKIKIAEAFSKNGDLCWDTVLSLPSFEFAKNHSLEIAEDYAAIVQKVLPEFFEKVGLQKSNMLYWMDYHINTSHPHIHLTFLEKNKTRSRGLFSPREIKMFKGMMYDKIMGKQKYFEAFSKDAVLAFKEKDELFNLLKDEMRIKIQTENRKETQELMKTLFQQLPKTGRMQYNSKQMYPYQKMINTVIDYLFKDAELENQLQNFLEKVKTFDRVKSEALHEKFDDFEKSETRKLYTQIGNAILKQYKDELEKSNLNASLIDSTLLQSLSNKNRLIDKNTNGQKEILDSMDINSFILSNKKKTNALNDYKSAIRESKEIEDPITKKIVSDFIKTNPNYFNHYSVKQMNVHYQKALHSIKKIMNDEDRKIEKSIEKYLEQGDRELL